MNRMGSRSFNTAVTLCAGLLLSGAQQVLAQAPTASQSVPSAIAPLYLRSQPDAVAQPMPGPVLPANGADVLTVTIRTFEVVDADPELTAQIRAEALRVEGRESTVRALYETAGRIEAIHAAAGYFLARATIPAQRIENGGAFTVQMVHGFIEEVEVHGLEATMAALVRRRLAGLVDARGLTFMQIERSLLLAGDVPGLTLKSALARGQAAGGVRLVVQGTFKPVTAVVGVDSHVADEFSGKQLSTQVGMSNLLGMGELFYVSAFGGPDLAEWVGGNPQRRVLGIGSVIPLGIDGLTLNPEYVTARIHPPERSGVLVTTGHFERVSVKLAYPLIRSRSQNLILAGALEAVDESQWADQFATALSMDRLRIASLALDWSGRAGPGLNVASHTAVTRGIDGLGARNAADVAATGVGFSRTGSRPDYTKLGAEVRLRHVSRGATGVSLTLRGQKSLTGALPSYGQFSLVGLDGLSAFAPGKLNVDSGITLRSELETRLTGAGFELVPYLFGAAGWGRVAEPTAVERARVHGTSFGLGFRSTLFHTDAGLPVQAAVEMSRGSASSIDGGSQSRLTFAASVRL